MPTHRMTCFLLMVGFMASLTAASHGDDLASSLAEIERLDTFVSSASWREAPLTDVLAEMEARYGLPIVGDWDALDLIGIEPDDEVTLELSRQSALSILGAVALTVGDAYDRPVFEVHTGRLVLTSIAGSEAMRLTAAYDVRDILARQDIIDHLRNAVKPTPATQPADSGGDPAANTQDDHRDAGDAGEPSQVARVIPPVRDPKRPGAYQPLRLNPPTLPKPVITEAPSMTPGEELINLITDHVDPDAWQNFGGSRAKVTEQAGVLMVTATPMTHFRLQRALAQLRRAIGSSLQIKATLIEIPTTGLDQVQQMYTDAPARAAIELLRAGTHLWSSDGPVALGRTLESSGPAGERTVSVTLSPSFDEARGQMRLAVELTTEREGAAQSRLATTTTLPGLDSAAILPLPRGGEEGTVTVLVVQTRRE